MDSKQLMDLILNAEQRHKECAKRVRETDRSKQIRAEFFERMRDYKSKQQQVRRVSPCQ
jgi:hypothetical protein